jgi:methyl-accepting chemotaxis protein
VKSKFENDLIESANYKISSEVDKLENQLFTTNSLLLDQVKTAVGILKDKTTQFGNARLENSFSLNNKSVPGLYFGTELMNQQYDLVDKVKEIAGGTATLFVKSENDFVRISTNVQKKDQTRAIGTILDPSGEAIKEITKGNSFYGLVEILGSFYITGYEPIKSGREVIGIWYAGYPITSLNEIGNSIAEITILENGFLALKNSKDEVLFHSDNITKDKIAIIIDESENEWEFVSKDFNEWDFKIIAAVYKPDIAKVIASIQFLVLALSIGFLITFSVITYFIIKKQILGRLSKLNELSQKISLGDLDVDINSNRIDEIGILEKSYHDMIHSMKDQAEMAENIANGNLQTNVKIKSDKDRLSISFSKMISALNFLIAEIKGLTVAAVDGNLKVRINTEKFSGDFKQIVDGINSTLDEVIKPINESTKVLSLIAEGDLRAQVIGNYKGDHQQLKNDINSLVDSLSDLVRRITESSEAIASSASEISSSSELMAAGAHEQSMQANEVAAAVEEMTQTINETTKNTVQASEASKNAGIIAKEGGNVVIETIEGMNKIADVVSRSAVTVQELGKSSNKIGDIVQVIDDIADQTNLLALNAAIEAARAGEHGRGFAVVADEVRKLAERTTNATKEIAEMITQIQKDTKQAVYSMQQGTSEVENGKLLAEKAGKSLSDIISGAENVVDIVNQVAAASEEQSTTSEQISKNITGISDVIRESSNGVQQMAQASEDLNRLTIHLQELVLRFKIEENANNYKTVNSNRTFASKAKVHSS